MSTVDGGWRGPNIVKDGLVLYLDAGSPNSYYGGTGTVWKDMSGNGNNGTLINGPTFNSANGGSIVFDGVDDYVNCGNTINPSKMTVNSWIKISTLNRYQHIVDSSNNNWHLAILNNNKPYFWNGTTYHQNTSSLSINTWYMITGVQGTTLDLYINGVLSQTISSNVNLTTSTIAISRWGYDNGSRYFSGNVPSVQIYNRALSVTEVLQNFNATRARFGI